MFEPINDCFKWRWSIRFSKWSDGRNEARKRERDREVVNRRGKIRNRTMCEWQCENKQIDHNLKFILMLIAIRFDFVFAACEMVVKQFSADLYFNLFCSFLSRLLRVLHHTPSSSVYKAKRKQKKEKTYHMLRLCWTENYVHCSAHG